MRHRRHFLVRGVLALAIFGTPAWAGLPSRFHEFAIIGDGAGLKTIFLISNKNQSAVGVTLQFFSSSGDPMSLTVGGQTGAQIQFQVPAGGMRRLETSGQGSVLKSGWSQL